MEKSRPSAVLRSPISVFLLALSLVWTGSAPAADGRWRLCPAPPARPPLPELPQGDTQVTADRATTEGKDRSVFSGNVVAERNGHRLEAEEAQYDRTTDVLTASGAVHVDTENLTLSGNRAHLDFAAERGTVEDANYYFPTGHAFGQARQLRFSGSEQARLSDATYTTCPPGGEEWKLSAQTIALDRNTNTGEAYNAVLYLGPVPAFYLPYLNFALEGRKSGFLLPSYGTSERNGTDIRIPWYWNIAPERDATFTPRIITARGPMLMSEYRYLGKQGGGQLQLDYLPDDKLFGADRYYASLLHRSQLSDAWSLAFDYRETSDRQYLDDIDNTLASASATHLERRLDVNYQGTGWNFLGRVQNFQALVPEPEAEPYQRAPQLLATGAGRYGGLHYDFSAEYVQFMHQDLDPTGTRLDLYPGVSAPLEGDYWFFTPRAALRHTQYALENATGPETPSRTLPIASLDAGLFLEREFTLAGAPLTQTLEPRLYYLYVPRENQDDLPVFDTVPLTFSFAQLFRENRFSGPDRVGEANQITTALTTRMLADSDGRELLRASIGQIQYFKHRRVGLPNEADDTRNTSDLAGELAGKPWPALEVAAATRWDPEISDAQESSIRLRYSPDPRRVLHAAYHYREAGQEMNRDMLVLWPLADRWHFVGRWYYDLVAERTLESVVGLEYENCCWTLRVLGRDRPFVTENNERQSDRSIHFTLELKGLSSIGESLESVIKEGIVGYR